jgi:hypothetical protein
VSYREMEKIDLDAPGKAVRARSMSIKTARLCR